MNLTTTRGCGPCSLPSSNVSSERNDWQAHPHFPAQTLLLASHHNFRGISRKLVADIEALAAGHSQDFGHLRASRLLFENWMRAMSGHEYYEEHKLYVFLTHRFGGSFDCLEEQHQSLHNARDVVREAYANANVSTLLEALKKHSDILYAHLDHEESVVIPLLLELQPHEFARYYRSPISALLKES